MPFRNVKPLLPLVQLVHSACMVGTLSLGGVAVAIQAEEAPTALPTTWLGFALEAQENQKNAVLTTPIGAVQVSLPLLRSAKRNWSLIGMLAKMIRLEWLIRGPYSYVHLLDLDWSVDNGWFCQKGATQCFGRAPQSLRQRQAVEKAVRKVLAGHQGPTLWKSFAL